MMGKGGIYRQKESTFYWMRYSLRGKQKRESTKVVAVDAPPAAAAKARNEAEKILRHRLQEVGADLIGARQFIEPKNRRLTVGQLLDDLIADYQVREVFTAQVASHIKPIRKALGDCLVADLDESDIRKYIQEARAAGKAKATINRGTQLLGQAWKLAGPKIGPAPKIPKLSETDNVRRGFLDPEDFQRFVVYLPEDLQDFARFAYLTGLRKSTLVALDWTMFDKRSETMNIPGSLIKNDRPLKLRIKGQLAEIIVRRYEKRSYKRADGTAAISQLIFYREGQHLGAPVADFDKAWAKACAAAGVKVLLHDFRRSAARNLRRAGVPESVCREWTGHKTESMFRRYNIVDEQDMDDAVSKLETYLAQSTASNVVQFAKPEENGSYAKTMLEIPANASKRQIKRK